MSSLLTKLLVWWESKQNKPVDSMRPQQVSPGHPDSYFSINLSTGMVGIKNYKITCNQDECMLYCGKHIIVDVRTREVSPWLEAQDISLWKYAKDCDDCHMSFTRYVINAELFTIMQLRW